MSAIHSLHNRIDLVKIPFTERGSRLLLFRRANALYIRVTERWVKWESEVGHYRQRAPILDNMRLLDGEGNSMPFTVDTFPHVVQAHTSAGDFDWTFADPETLLVRLPAGRVGISFEAQVDEATTDRRGVTMHGKRNIAFTTNAKIIRNTLTAIDEQHYHGEMIMEADGNQALLVNITPRLGFNRSAPDASTTLEEAQAAWEAWYEQVPDVLDEYRTQYHYAWWVMRIGLLSTRYYFTREASVPSKIHYVGVWHWDQFFHAIAFRHVDTHLAEDQIRILIDHQQPNGMFPDAIHDEGLITHLTKPVDADVTKPPLMAWTVLKLYETSGHRDFLEEVYEPLVRWHGWWVNENRDPETGLFYYQHPFSSGLDDSPLWDYGMPVIAPDLNTYLYLQAESIARIAEIIGEAQDAERYRESARDHLERMLRYLWDEEKGYFNALCNGEPVPVFSLFHLMPLWTGALPDAINERLLAHLTDPAAFWTRWPLPTISASDPHFDPFQMWRGPTWTNINSLFVEALRRVGRADLAGELRRRTLELMMQHPDIFEYYHPITGEIPPKSAPIFGWSSAVFIDLALQETAAQKRTEGQQSQQ